MKKTFLALLLAGSTCAAFAQVDTMGRGSIGNTTNTGVFDTSMSSSVGTLSSNDTYNAYSSYNAAAPEYVYSYVLRDYPGVTDVHWMQTPDWWHGYYLTNGQPMHVYYNTTGQTFTASLPVKQNLIPDEVVSKANAMWGPSVYDITTVKGAQGQDVYLVRTIENGQLSSQWIGADGSKVIDIYRVDNADPMTNGSMNATSPQPAMSTDAATTTTTDASTTTDATTSDMSTTTDSSTGSDKIKIKTRTPDGKKKVTKIVNGKVTTTKGE